MTESGTSPDKKRDAKLSQTLTHAWRNWGDHPAVVFMTIVAALAGIVSTFVVLKDRPSHALPPQAEAKTPAPESPSQECPDITGRWRWATTGGVVAIAKTGTIEWYRLAGDPTPLINGTWDCNPSDPTHFTFRWFQTNLVDTLRLSRDLRRLNGATTINGFRLSGTRLR